MTSYFTKDFSNFFRIPESRLLRSNAAWDVYLFLQDMVYRKETGFYGNNNHYESGIMASKYREGKIGTFTTVLEIEKYRGLSKNTVKDALKVLVRLGLVRLPEGINPETPWDNKGMFYQVGYRLRNKHGRYEGDETFMAKLDRSLDTMEAAQRVQKTLIAVFKPNATPLPIYNLRYEGVTSSTVRKTPKVKNIKEVKTVAPETLVKDIEEDIPSDGSDEIIEEAADSVYSAIDQGYKGVDRVSVISKLYDFADDYGIIYSDIAFDFFKANWQYHKDKSLEDILTLGLDSHYHQAAD